MALSCIEDSMPQYQALSSDLYITFVPSSVIVTELWRWCTIYCWAFSSHILLESLVLQFLSEKNEATISVPGLSELEVRFLLHEDLLGTDCWSGAEASSVDSIMRKMLLQSYRKCLQDRHLEWSDLPLPWVHPRCIINVMCCTFLRTLGHRCRC